MVNILDVLDQEIEKLKSKYDGDRLKILFDLQKDLMNDYGVEVKSIHSPKMQEQIRRYAYFFIEELFEGLHLLKNRPWTKNHVLVDENRLKDEIADMSLFFFQLMHMLGVDVDEFFELCLKKTVINKFRLRTGY